MKKKFLILIAIMVFVFSAGVYADVKGDCPDMDIPCQDSMTCGYGESCINGYYCSEVSYAQASCQYAGYNVEHCDAAGGTWDNNFWGGTACVKDNTYAGGFEQCESVTQGWVSGIVYDCLEGYYCAYANTAQGSQFYCAPPSFSQEHCIVADGIWDNVTKICDVSIDTCNDGILNGDETGIDCGGDICPPCLIEPPMPTTCEDSILNGDETDVDCGGSCGPCDIGDACLTNSDCISKECDEDQALHPICVASSEKPRCGNKICDKGEDYFNCRKDCKLSSESLKLLTSLEKKMCSYEKDICCGKFKNIAQDYRTGMQSNKEEPVPKKPEIVMPKPKARIFPKFNLFDRFRLSFTGRFFDF